MWFAGILMIGYNARLKILVPVTSVCSQGFSDLSALEKSETQLIAADLVRVSLRPGHHQQTETTAQR